MTYELIEGDPYAHPVVVKIPVRAFGIAKVVIVRREHRE